MISKMHHVLDKRSILSCTQFLRNFYTKFLKFTSIPSSVATDKWPKNGCVVIRYTEFARSNPKGGRPKKSEHGNQKRLEIYGDREKNVNDTLEILFKVMKNKPTLINSDFKDRIAPTEINSSATTQHISLKVNGKDFNITVNELNTEVNNEDEDSIDDNSNQFSVKTIYDWDSAEANLTQNETRSRGKKRVHSDVD